MSGFRANTYLSGANAAYVGELYQLYLQNPNAVDGEWRSYFAALGGDTAEAANKDFGGVAWAKAGKTAIIGYRSPEDLEAEKKKAAAKQVAAPASKQDASSDSIRIHQIIRAYRLRGHLLAHLDPLGLEHIAPHPELDPAHFGFTDADFDRPIYVGGWLGMENATLREVLDNLHHIYCGTIGIEIGHITDAEQRDWLENRIESARGKPQFSAAEKKEILQQLVRVEGFEQFLHVKYPGTKRFGVEGSDSTVAAMEALLATSAELGVEEIVVGMPHRGRLNVLTAFMGKSYSAMLSEFQGNTAHPEGLAISGDVKYHLGTSSDRKLGGGKTVHLSLTANPSHLEAVNPVVVGKVRAKQDQKKDLERSKVMGLLLHGDAAFAGQGLVAETLSLGDLVGYGTGGTFHIIVNNQIGFTTDPKNARLSRYPSEVAKMAQAPIFHVNGDDPEAVVFVAKVAAEYRHLFKKDVVLDVFGYRRHGHNEGDEPQFTQPLMYQQIARQKTVCDIYAAQLAAEGVLSEAEYKEIRKKWNDFLEGEKAAADAYKPNKADWLEGKWIGFEKPKERAPRPATGVDVKKLKEIGLSLAKTPADFTVHSKIVRQLEAKKTMMETGEGIDWAMGEALAFGSLLAENIPVRLSGQDCERGTFSHRHSVLNDQVNEATYTPLNHIAEPQAKYEVINSNLSEFAVLGYEYGYSLAEPKSLVLWEGQFGDFVNGAQVIIDQFISSAEVKWLRMSGLVMLLPHGYEGQGPEHSSARLERFLQLCAEDNMQVCNPTTPANYFHLLRRQIVRNFRKPLIIMSPKSLLRHKLAQSTLADMGKGTSFVHVIPDTEKLVAAAKVKRVVLTSGKVYYDLVEARAKEKINDVAILRLEQYYPFPDQEVTEALKPYKNAEVVWCQEEPQNMGAWDFVDPRIEEVLIGLKGACTRPGYVGRRSSASPATGYMKTHTKEQQSLVMEALKV
jgi:2-oxoglutarate dehydrogenase E1 component